MENGAGGLRAVGVGSSRSNGGDSDGSGDGNDIAVGGCDSDCNGDGNDISRAPPEQRSRLACSLRGLPDQLSGGQSKLMLRGFVQLGMRWLPAAPAQLEQCRLALSRPATFVTAAAVATCARVFAAMVAVATAALGVPCFGVCRGQQTVKARAPLQ